MSPDPSKNTSNKKRKRIPDPDEFRIRESYQTKGECLRIRILESGFGNFYADPRFASDPYSTVRIHSSGTNRALLMFCRGARHLDQPPEAYAMPIAGPNANRSGWSPNPLACYQLTLLAYCYLYGNSPEPPLSGRSSMSAWLGGLGGIVRKGI